MLKNFSLIILVLLFACESAPDQPKDVFEGMTVQEKKKSLESAITRATVKEQTQIVAYFERQQIPSIKTSTGVHYHIYQEGVGDSIQADQLVSVSYLITNIMGDTIYTVEPDSLETFMVEKSNKESGLHEVLKNLKKGCKAIIAIPSHRAHGMTGDDKDIPPLTTVVYNLHIVDVQ